MHQMQDMSLTSNIMLNLKVVSSYQGLADRQDSMRSLLNAKIYEGTLVRDHCLKMISFFNVLKKGLGCKD